MKYFFKRPYDVYTNCTYILANLFLIYRILLNYTFVQPETDVNAIYRASIGRQPYDGPSSTEPSSASSEPPNPRSPLPPSRKMDGAQGFKLPFTQSMSPVEYCRTFYRTHCRLLVDIRDVC